MIQVRRALISCHDKDALPRFARRLTDAGVEILATGGTASRLAEEGIPAEDLTEALGLSAALGGRVKTLHPSLHMAILYRRGHEEDEAELAAHPALPIDLVCVTLYPFEEAAREGLTGQELVEQIDIGGPTLLRAAAKNHAHVVAIPGPEHYGEVAGSIEEEGGVPMELSLRLARAVFRRTAAYDHAISVAIGGTAGTRRPDDPLPDPLVVESPRVRRLRYGENPHQAGALHGRADARGGVAGARKLAGAKDLSYNNVLDLDAAQALALELPDRAAVVVKHQVPCGAAVADEAVEAVRRALAGDPMSAYGGIVCLDGPLSPAIAGALCEARYLEVIGAPEIEPAALEILGERPRWRRNVRIVEIRPPTGPRLGIRDIGGGLLVQTPDDASDPFGPESRVATRRAPEEDEHGDLTVAWAVCRHVRSNAIVLVRDGAVCGVGAGQPSRVDAVDIACRKAGDRAEGAVLASDAFFPFRDGPDRAAEAGVRAIVQPGGSRRVDEVVTAADEHGMAMVLTGVRHFRH